MNTLHVSVESIGPLKVTIKSVCLYQAIKSDLIKSERSNLFAMFACKPPKTIKFGV